MKLFLNLFFLVTLSMFANKTQFLILILSYNNERWVEGNILSALNQEYPNFRIIYVNDASTDGTEERLKDVIENHPKKNIVNFYSNSTNKGAASNLYYYIHKFVKDEEVVVCLDGDDQLSNPDVLDTLDKVYQNPNREVWITYGQYKNLSKGKIGHCAPVPYANEGNNPIHLGYRKQDFRFSHLRTFKGWLFKKIRKKDLYFGENFVNMAADVAIMWPMIEMASNGHFQFIDKILYVYNDMNVLNDHNISRQSQTNVHGYIAKKAAYIPLD